MNSETNDKTAIDYCINKAIPNGSNLYYATIYDKGQNKTVIITLHAFLNELTDIIYECSDPGIARIKLNWWQEEIERLFNKQARHPVTRKIQECITLDQNSKSIFDCIIECFDKFLFIEQPESLDAILSLYESTTGEIWHQCGRQLNLTNTESLLFMRDTGSITHYISCLQQPNTYINETRCIVPEIFINKTDLLNFRIDPVNNKLNQEEVFSPLLLDLKIRLDEIYKKLATRDRHNFQHGLILNRLVVKTCDEILSDGCNLLNTSTSLTPLRKLWIAWWTHSTLSFPA